MWTVLIALAVGWLAVCVAAFVLQERLIFFPGGPPSATPASIGLPFEGVELVAADGATIDAWWIPAERARGAVIVCHGNAGNIEGRLPLAVALHRLDLAVLLFDYRGYGASTGRPSEQGLYLDAEAAYDYVVQAARIAPARIVAYGESLGGAVAAELASRRPVGALVLDAAFTSLADVGASTYRFLPVRFILRHGFDTRAKLAKLSVPVLLMHSPDDEVVPASHAEALRRCAREPVEFVSTAGFHNDGGWLRSGALGASVARFFERHLPPL